MVSLLLKDSSMRRWRFWAIRAPRSSLALAACLWAGAACLPASANPSRVIILGDSIGVGLSLAGGSQRLAANSVGIRSNQIIEQLSRVDASQVAVVSLGTNDAVGHLRGVEKAIDQIIETVNRKNLRVVWMGPPCVNKDWNTNVVQLDRILQERLRRAPRITYVSVADQNYCDRNLRASDGVHFTRPGARKAAHFVEMEINRLVDSIEPRIEPAVVTVDPAANGEPSSQVPAPPAPVAEPVKVMAAPVVTLPALAPAPEVVIPVRPAAGAVVPLTGPLNAKGGELATTRTRRSGEASDAEALLDRALVQGRPMDPRPGRADDFSWPRR
jgi:lysophospholipase L1-like esterase